jgi:uncharacterized delta-60 repeat protein
LLLALHVCANAQSPAQAWVQRFGKPSSSADMASAIALDPDGNVIVAGSTANGITACEMLVIKYTSAGAVLWTNRFRGPSGLGAAATAAAVDSIGQIFVTGFETNGGTSSYLTVALNSAGTLLWANVFGVARTLGDGPTAIAVGADGRVFVTGSAYDGTGFKYVTVAYSNQGLPLWTNSFGTGIGYARGVAADGSGTVFVTGSSRMANGNDMFATVAYSNAGIPLWTNSYTGGTNGGANGLALDGGGNVFVTGYSLGLNGNYEHATIKYSNDGIGLWTNRYPDSPYQMTRPLVVDTNGDVVVAGPTTIKYSGSGVLSWSAPFTGIASQLAVDSNGNVFVAGFSASRYSMTKYSAAGQTLWTTNYSESSVSNDKATSIAISAANDIFVTGNSWNGADFDIASVQYSNSGAPIRTNRYNQGSANTDDQPTAVGSDFSGNIFVTGTTSGGFATIAFSPTGAALWTNYYNNGLSNSTHHAQALKLDAAGNVFVTGYSKASNGYYDFATLKYSSNGTALWTNRYNGPGGQDDYPQDMVIGNDGNVVVTGYSRGPSSKDDYVTIAYSNSGAGLWTNRFHGSGTGNDHAQAVAIDDSGNVFVTGSSSTNTPFGTDYYYVTIAYSSAGVALWTNRYGNIPLGNYPQAIAVDHFGKVFVTGYSHGNDQDDFATLAYSVGGTPLWTNRYTGPRSFGNDHANAMCVDDAGNVYVTGNSPGTNGINDFATVAYSNNGTPLWTNRYDGPASGVDVATCIAADGSGHIFVGGYSSVSGSGYDFVLIAYSTTGFPLFTNRYNGPANGDDEPLTRQSIAATPGGVVLIGASDGDFTSGALFDYAVVKYLFPGPFFGFGSPKLFDANLTIPGSGTPNTAWRVQAASGIGGPWNDVGTMFLGPSGSGVFNGNSPASSGYYRALWLP